MIRRLVAASAALTAMCAMGASTRVLAVLQNPRPQAPAGVGASAGTGQIAGRVVDASSGAPISDAIVAIRPPGRSASQRLLVDGRGQFQYRGLPAGAITLTATSEGYLSGGAGARTANGSAVPIQLGDGQHLSDVTIRLWRLSTISGTVFDDNGDPITGASARLLRRTAGARRLIPEGTATTDDRGVFQFSSLGPGRYVVVVPFTTTSMPRSVADAYMAQVNDSVSPLVRGSATATPLPSAPGFQVGDMLLQPSTGLARAAPAPTADSRVSVYQTTFYPGANVASQAQDIDLGPGDDHSGIDLRLSLVSAVSVSGSIAGSDVPLASVELRLIPGDAADWSDDSGFETALTVTDAEGRFTFLGVPPGQYTIDGTAPSSLARLRAMAASGTNASPRDVHWIRALVGVGDEAVTGLTLTARAGLRVGGRVRFVGSSPAPTPAELGLVSVQLDPERGGDLNPLLARLAADGRFTIDGLLPGRYTIDISQPSEMNASWTVASETANGRDLMAPTLDLGDDVADLVITLTDRPSEIAGTIETDGRPHDPFDVVVFPADYAAAADAGMLAQRSRLVSADSSRFVVDGLPAGNYLVAVISISETTNWMEPAVIRTIASQATAVSIADRAHVSVTVKPVVIR